MKKTHASYPRRNSESQPGGWARSARVATRFAVYDAFGATPGRIDHLGGCVCGAFLVQSGRRLASGCEQRWAG